VRALGETDLNPVSGLGKISQLLFAVLQPGNVVANLVAGAPLPALALLRILISLIRYRWCNGGWSATVSLETSIRLRLVELVFFRAGDLMQDLKTGHLVGASPRAQFWGQLVGSSVSIVVTTTAYNLYTRAYDIPGPSFPAPTAYVWLSLARLLRAHFLWICDDRSLAQPFFR
jgi:hypothetical protein